MSPIRDEFVAGLPLEQDLVTNLETILLQSQEPLTLTKIRSLLSPRFRHLTLEEMESVANRQIAAGVWYEYPKYRSQHYRYWDRPMEIHLARLINLTLKDKPLGLSELRRKLPDYAKPRVEGVLQDLLSKGKLFCHPPVDGRSGIRYGIERPDAKNYLRREIGAALAKVEQLGFSYGELREAALQILNEGWSKHLSHSESETFTPSPYYLSALNGSQSNSHYPQSNGNGKKGINGNGAPAMVKNHH